MKRYFIYLIFGILGLMNSCQEPDEIVTTDSGADIKSFTVFRMNADGSRTVLLDNWAVTDPSATKFVIPVPFYYPESSDNETSISEVKIQASIGTNCYIEPQIGVLDLTKENFFTLINSKGERRQICITGERAKSDKCQLVSFALRSPALNGVVDEATHTISLITADDLSACLADIVLSAHATVSPDPGVTPLNFNEPLELTVTAHNGTDKTVYTVKKNIPEKIAYGFNTPMTELFSLDATNILGIPWEVTNAPTLGVTGGQLVVCMGDGTTPAYYNQVTGAKGGVINLGAASAGCITSDEGEHLLICNAVAAGGICNLYITSSVKEAPQLFYSFTNTAGLPMGAKMKVIGDVTKEAIIILTNDGITGVTSSSKFTRIVVTNGIVQTPEVVDISAAGLEWGAAPVNSTSVVSASTNINDGSFLSYYDANNFLYLNGSNQVAATLANPDGNSWALNQNCLDSKKFNNANYVALFLVAHFPHWGVGPQIFLYDVTNKSSVTGDVYSSPALVFKNSSLAWYQSSDAKTASGDVLVAPSADGFKLYLYYYDNNSATIGGYVADCIKK